MVPVQMVCVGNGGEKRVGMLGQRREEREGETRKETEGERGVMRGRMKRDGAGWTDRC